MGISRRDLLRLGAVALVPACAGRDPFAGIAEKEHTLQCIGASPRNLTISNAVRCGLRFDNARWQGYGRIVFTIA